MALAAYEDYPRRRTLFNRTSLLQAITQKKGTFHTSVIGRIPFSFLELSTNLSSSQQCLMENFAKDRQDADFAPSRFSILGDGMDPGRSLQLDAVPPTCRDFLSHSWDR